MFKELTNKIPTSEPDLQIGPLCLWVTGYTDPNQAGQGTLAYLQTPSLLDSENIVVFSNSSQTPLFQIEAFLKGNLKVAGC
jgi:hypothetical protein